MQTPIARVWLVVSGFAMWRSDRCVRAAERRGRSVVSGAVPGAAPGAVRPRHPERRRSVGS